MSSNSTSTSSFGRTGLKAGTSFATAVIQGFVLAFVLSGGMLAR